MNIADAKQQVKQTVEAYLTKDDAGMYRISVAHQRPIFLLGAPGIGKTAIMAQVADELGIGLVSYSMTHHTRQSALGLPVVVRKEYGGRDVDVSEYTMSEIIASIYDYMAETGRSRGILFLDEINCVSETLYPSMLQFLQFKTFGRHRVPDGWVVVCAGNPPAYNRSVHEFDIVTLDRLRKLEVEPDFEAWKEYARQTGVHPAILTYLEVRRDDFYFAETTTSGKHFVSARGWSDLSEIITLFEELGTLVGRELVEQYVQDPEIAERFALYYDLFNKYRSDYQVDEILRGQVSPDIVKRAKEAAFDERLALLGLMLDGVSGLAAKALEREAVLMDVRDVLRAVKECIISGASAKDELAAAIAEREERLEKRQKADTATAIDLRVARLAVAMLKGFVAHCDLQQSVQGAAAFEVVQADFKAEVETLQPLVDQASVAIDNAFSFIDQAFGADREQLVFVTELTARRATARFINRFGSDSYYAHNDELMVDARRDDLLSEIDKLEL
mgnify:FL=1